MSMLKGLSKADALAAVTEVMDRGGWAVVTPADDLGTRRFLVGELNPVIAKGVLFMAAGAVSSWWGKRGTASKGGS